MSELRNTVIRLTLQAGKPYGLALGGGNALQAHRIVSRETQDVDEFVNDLEPELYDILEKVIVSTLEANNIQTKIIERNDFLRVIEATDRESNDTVILDINYGHRDHPTVDIESFGAVLDLKDIAAGKLIAFCDRRAARDYIDLYAMLDTKSLAINDLIKMLNKVKPDVTTDDFVSYLEEAKLHKNEIINNYGFTPTGYDQLIAHIQKLIKYLKN
jgi:predicted nucleotidyltransferase component of viral defense system